MSDDGLVVNDVTKTYPTRAESLEVLRGVTFSLAPGENLAIVGASGSGKSTLLSILGALETPTSGTVRLRGDDPFAFQSADARLAHFRNRQIGFVFQDHHLLPQCSVLENVLLPTIADEMRAKDIEGHARALIERVGLENRIHHRPGELSGGERQRAAIARALINSPTLVLADEPTGNLDRTTAAEIGRLLLETQAERRTMLIVVTHSPDLAGLMTRRLALDQGKLHSAP